MRCHFALLFAAFAAATDVSTPVMPSVPSSPASPSKTPVESAPKEAPEPVKAPADSPAEAPEPVKAPADSPAGAPENPGETPFEPPTEVKTPVDAPEEAPMEPEPESSSGLSGGAKFLIVFFVLSGTYFFGGCAIKYWRFGKGFPDCIPNLDFWRAVWGNFKLGLRRATCRPMDGQYSSIN